MIHNEIKVNDPCSHRLFSLKILLFLTNIINPIYINYLSSIEDSMIFIDFFSNVITLILIYIIYILNSNFANIYLLIFQYTKLAYSLR